VSRPRLTKGTVKSLLVVARTNTALTRLLDVIELTRRDIRIQTHFTIDRARDAVFGAGLPEYLRDIMAPVMPWEEAKSRRFDLVISASENDALSELDGPILLLPHGMGFQKYYPQSSVVAGMDPRRLFIDGKVVPTRIALSHERQRELLAEICPQAVDRAVVIGDPALDRMLASDHQKAQVEGALEARGKAIVVVASTWGQESLFGSYSELPDDLVAALPFDEYKVAVILHPGIWAAHGTWQVRSWLGRARAAGVSLIDPNHGWQAALAAAACVISDHGSVSLYAAALGKPLLLSPNFAKTTVAGSPAEDLREVATRLDPAGDLLQQISTAITSHSPGTLQAVVDSVVDGPGQSGQRLRPIIYDLLRLSEPASPVYPTPVAIPRKSEDGIGALVVGAKLFGTAVKLTRYPDMWVDPSRTSLDFRHLVTFAAHASYGQLAGSAILCLSSVLPNWDQIAARHLRNRQHLCLIAAVVDDNTCQVTGRGFTVLLSADLRSSGLDPSILASLVYVRMCQSETMMPVRDDLVVGDRVIAVRVKEVF
jgi:hypothetical protein